MAKLNQVIAIEKGIKSGSYSTVSELHKINKKPDLFNGFSKQYQPNDEQGEQLPPESKRVQQTVGDTLRVTQNVQSEHFNVTARKDYTNCVAKADVTVDGNTLVTGAPVSYLLFLEKQLLDIRTFVNDLPVLDSAEDWTLDPNSGLYKTREIKTHRTKKVQKPIVLYPATPEHAAQTQLITEDVIVGFWNQVKMSGAVPPTRKIDLLDRVELLIKAVKQAREEANNVDEVATSDIGTSIFEYLFKE